jgi:hypothetical protein
MERFEPGRHGEGSSDHMTLSPDEQSLVTSFGQNWLLNSAFPKPEFYYKACNYPDCARSVAPIFSTEDIPDRLLLKAVALTMERPAVICARRLLMDYEDYTFSLGYSLVMSLRYLRGYRCCRRRFFRGWYGFLRCDKIPSI